ncbi:hypothetical protein GFL93_09410 [Rhizobium leguminosarum bv. viciae]|uniref:hypothetical protein n=1 Tax=Rhizobium TaxID=379 RepID=UPI00144150BC|nr:hypothetical protein [Rhizobium leguminosarum]NKK06088.1 hypothetical protein [Rhizobium leguminosarum bv. viciae]
MAGFENPELATLTSLSRLIGGDSLPISAMQASAKQDNVLDTEAKRYQGISDSFKSGGLTPLTAILKGVTGGIAASKSEKAQTERDAKQARLDSLIQWKAQNEQHQAEVQQMLASHQEASLTGHQLAQSIDQLSAGDESGIRNWFASNPETAKMMSARLGIPVVSATYTKIDGVDTLIPYGRDAQGNTVTGEPLAVDALLKGYAPDAYQARYASRQANAMAEQDLELKKAQVESEKAQGRNYDAQAEAKVNPVPKPLPAPAVKLQQEALDAIGSINQTNQNIDGIIAQIDSGNLLTDIANRSVSKAANFVGSSTPQSRALSSYDANIKKMVNDSLLLAKGVQTEGDAQRAADAILAAPYDTQAVKERLAELRQINARSAEMKKLANDQLRAEFGHEPMDYSGFETAAAKPAPSAAAPTYAVNPKTGERLMLQGGKWVPAK